ncbi:Hypothetical predicted protein, partial [Pelobates cultripes]
HSARRLPKPGASKAAHRWLQASKRRDARQCMRHTRLTHRAHHLTPLEMSLNPTRPQTSAKSVPASRQIWSWDSSLSGLCSTALYTSLGLQ